MKVIIAGSRTVKSYYDVLSAVREASSRMGIVASTVLCGGAPGADAIGALWAETNGVHVKMFRADWDKHGRAAGPIRNQEMVDHADALIAIWDGQSKGTRDVISRAKRKGIPVFVAPVTAKTE